MTIEPIELQLSERGANGRLPIRCFTGEHLLPDEPAQDQLAELSTVPGLVGHIAVLPDVHYKSRNPSPTGTVVVSKDVLVPRAIDEGINCGMRMMATSLPAAAFSEAMLDAFYGRLLATIPYKKYDTPLVGRETLEAMLLQGQRPLVEAMGLPEEECARVENGGQMLSGLDPEEVRAGIGDIIQEAIRKGGKAFGTIGGGNHFLELQEVVEVLDEETAVALGLHLGQAVFMLHTDSRGLGKRILQPVLTEAAAAYRPSSPNGDLWTIPAESEDGRRYRYAIAAASHAGFANRAVVTHLVRQTLQAIFPDASLSLLFDCGHETIQQEAIAGETYWVHRHGASHALPPGDSRLDPALRPLGQPVPLPGNMGVDSFIAVARPGAEQTFYSVAHGAGRVMAKDTAAEVYDEAAVQADVRGRGIRIYRYGVDNIAGQAPASFKDAEQVLNVMRELEMIQPVVRVRPFAVLKG